MPRTPPFDLSTLVLVSLAVIFGLIAYWKDPGLPWIGARTGLSLLWLVLPRLIPALILAGMLQVVIPQETVARYFGRQSGLMAILMATLAGIVTPGGPMVTVPLLVVLANSGMALGPMVAYMTSWSLFGMQRIIAWEAPLMGWHFVFVRVVPSLAFPVIAGLLVKLYYHE
ncbi:MAG: permease [Candidatus Rokubacteria bacterium]|nr:permease [Candidatus Rokubacteria bacterium]MBI3105930.1 permease [Candidatus Rokubacteria bacterium]